ncbi:hypothetical protein GCM10010260_81940 [Streptomyces filipinensis]|uniref:Uncharacterized protein n=3 Tax=Streptomyces TaxID=1883 RepID=A0A918IK01_9ACTN|nr:hypothetical protein [Streptomyces sp. SPB4]GGV29067.1 hypothetical protein GCM10010260_81940 [Streptomyces filipinensis]
MSTMPTPAQTATRAKAVLAAVLADEEFGAFEAATLEYSSDWQCFTGFPVIERWSLDTDKGPLFTEGLRALALKAAVFGLTGDEHLAEVAVAVPVDEMTHAMIAQPQLFARIADRTGFKLIHQTDQEHTDYEVGDFTHRAYRLAWGEPPARYWLPKGEVDRRVTILTERYAAIGMDRAGREHDIAFTSA